MSGINFTSPDDVRLKTLAELISQIKAAPQAWKNIFHARYFKPDPAKTYFDALTPEAEELLKPFPQRQKRLDQIKAYFDELLKCAGNLVGAEGVVQLLPHAQVQDEDALAFWLDLLRRESARFRPLGESDGTLDNVLDATVELLEPVELLERLGGTGRLPLLTAQASAEEKQPVATSGEVEPAPANEPAAAEDDNALAFEIVLRTDAPLAPLLADKLLDEPGHAGERNKKLIAQLTDIAEAFKTPPATPAAREGRMAERITLFTLAVQNIGHNASTVEEFDLAVVTLICWALKQTDAAAIWLEERQEADGFRISIVPGIRRFLFNDWAPYVLARRGLAKRIEKERTNQTTGQEPYREFPFMLYHAGGKTKTVYYEEEREAALAEGWSKDPVTWQVNPRTGRRKWAPEISQYMQDNVIKDDKKLIHILAIGDNPVSISLDTLRAIKSGRKGCSLDTVRAVLRKMKIPHAQLTL